MIEPGDCCPECNQRKPHPRKQTSPDSRVRSYRLPLEENDSHAEILQVAAEHLGCFDRPFWQFQTLTYALALVLQDESLKNIAKR